MEHTKGEVEAAFDGDTIDIYIKSEPQSVICTIDGVYDVNKANARRTVETWNMHDELVEALKVANSRISSLQEYFTASNFTDRGGDAEQNRLALIIIKGTIYLTIPTSEIMTLIIK